MINISEHRITNLRTTAKQPPLVQPPQRSTVAQGAVQIRIKNSQSSGDRLSQSKSMVLQESDLPQKPISRHRRNQSQHNVLVQLKGEHLNVAKISESGKKQRKNWTLMWSILTSDQLLLYKERQQETSQQKPGSKTDVVQLCGAFIEWTTEKSSRKNVFQITTNTGSEYLLQTDSYSTASKWYDAIRKTIDSSVRTHFLLECLFLLSIGVSNVHPSFSKLKHSTSDSADKNGVKNRLKKFIIRRPSMKTLQEKGLIKDRIFGCHLLTLCEREGTTVPQFVRICLDAVDKRGLEVDGIYRVSGNLATIQKLRFIVDQEEDLDLDHSQWEDIHVVTGALKMFFRELPEPLFPFRFFQPFVEAIKIKEPTHKVQAMKKLIQELPKPNQDTMKLLFSHLHRVLAFSRKNLMSTQGIGIVFGPTLMWPELDAGNMAFNMVYQNQIVEFILIESRQIFNLDRK
uniref:Rho GTPase-activating protein 15 n=1 Tax=Dicentrarchus labrax TaxID=13489 RepID=A0A8P4KA15_DICLA